MLDLFNLSNKTALITGAGGLLGIAHASALLELGARVVLTDIHLENLEQKKNFLKEHHCENNILCHVVDVRKKKSVSEVENRLKQNGIQIDILINNAAIDAKVDKHSQGLEKSRLEFFSLEQWNQEIDVGLSGAFLCSQIFGVQMAKRGHGVILNIASDLSVIAPDQRLYRKENTPDELQPVKPITYSVIKTGLIGLTRYLASYWASQGVRVNALSPGGVQVNQSDSFVERIKNLIPMNRMAYQDDYQGAVQFLCSNASSYMTGQNLVIDGGRSIL